jgi:hypothetical protein
MSSRTGIVFPSGVSIIIIIPSSRSKETYDQRYAFAVGDTGIRPSSADGYKMPMRNPRRRGEGMSPYGR